MQTKVLHILVGLPRSGKSTKARAIADDQEYLMPIIERMASNFQWLNDEDC